MFPVQWGKCDLGTTVFVWENQTSSTEKVGNIPIEFEAFAGFFQKVVGKIQETLGKGWSMYV